MKLAALAILLPWPIWSQVPAIIVQPTGVFDLPFNATATSLRADGNDSGFYVLQSGSTGTVVLHFSPAGQFLHPTWVEGDPPSNFAVDHAGNVAVDIDQPDHSTTMVFDASGKESNHLVLMHDRARLFYDGSSLLSLVRGRVYREPDAKLLLDLGAPFPQERFYAASLAPDSLAMIGQISATLVIANYKTGKTTSVELKAPEIEVDPGGRRLAVLAIAVSQQGEIFCAITPYTEDKATILQFDAAGRLMGRFLCVLPAFDFLRTNGRPKGNLLVDQIAFSSGHLAIFSELDRKYAIYRLR